MISEQINSDSASGPAGGYFTPHATRADGKGDVMSFLCRLGLHRVSGLPVWNDGFYFSTCKRCGCDLVRTAFERWHAPSGQRVVWSPTPPESRPTVKLTPRQVDSQDVESTPSAKSVETTGIDSLPGADTAAAPSPDSPSIGEVLSLLRQEDSLAAEGGILLGSTAGSAPGTESADRMVSDKPDGEITQAPLIAVPAGNVASSEPAQEPSGPAMPNRDISEEGGLEKANRTIEEGSSDAVDVPCSAPEAETRLAAEQKGPTPQPTYVDDFMAEPEQLDYHNGFWESEEQNTAVNSQPELLLTRPPSPSDEVPQPRQASEHEIGFTGTSRDTSRAHSVERPPFQTFLSDRPKTGIVETLLDRGPYVALVVSSVAMLLLALPRPGVAESSPAAVIQPVAESPPNTRSEDTSGFVTARLLNCRASPILGARSLRILARGESVQILAREPGWLSIAHRDRQCWVVERYVSKPKPL
jgi:hypothetical protein